MFKIFFNTSAIAEVQLQIKINVYDNRTINIHKFILKHTYFIQHYGIFSHKFYDTLKLNFGQK